MSEKDPAIDTEEFWDAATRGRTEPLRPDPKDEHIAIEFRYGRITRLFCVTVLHKERGDLSRFWIEAGDERGQVGGAVITISARKFRHLQQWQLWIVRADRLLNWLRQEGGCTTLGMEILKFGEQKPDGTQIACGPRFPSLDEMLGQFNQAYWFHNRVFLHNLWTPTTQAEMDAEKAEQSDGAGTS